MVGSELTIFSNIIGAFITQVYGDLLGSPQYIILVTFYGITISYLQMLFPLLQENPSLASVGEDATG